MKETTNVNIGGQAFTTDNDAYRLLSDYLKDVRSRINCDTDEVMADIEQGLASILREMLPSPVMVVTRSMTEEAIRRMGKPEEFGPRRSAYEQTAEDETTQIKRLYRPRTDRVFAGVCGGIAKYFGVDASIMRMLTLVLIIFGGLSLWVYIIMWLIIPEEPLKFNPPK